MSKIALTPDVDGTGTLSIVSPNTNTNRTLTLPDETGTVLTSGAALPAISGAALTNLTSANLTGALPAIDGSALTDLTSANLTGALPAIDGSALTGVGASTTYDAVGTYVFGYRYGGGVGNGDTYAGSEIYPGGYGNTYSIDADGWQSPIVNTRGGSALSGTWRAMGRHRYEVDVNRSRFTLFVRIS